MTMSSEEESAAVVQSSEHDLKFAHANVGYVIDGQEDATVRYELERDISEGDLLKMLTPNGNVFGYADVEDVFTAELRHAFFDMTTADGRSHPATGTFDLQDRLNVHYQDEVATTDEVTVIEFDLWQVGGANPA